MSMIQPGWSVWGNGVYISTAACAYFLCGACGDCLGVFCAGGSLLSKKVTFGICEGDGINDTLFTERKK